MPSSASAARRAAALAAGLIIGVASAPAARAALLFQTATLDPAAITAGNSIVLKGDGTTQGDGFFGGSLFVGADFVITATTQITGIGASFINTARESATGNIFGAIVQVDPVTGLPTQSVENLASITLGSALFTPSTDGDTTASLSLLLQPGTYGLVFGSGLFGASGVGDLLAGNTTVGTPSIFVNQFAPFAADPSDADVRLFVDGTAVPEPSSLILSLSALAALGGFIRRRG